MKDNETQPEWWNIHNVAAFLQVSLPAARSWMWRNKVKRSSSNNRLTRKDWVEEALNKSKP